MAKQLQSPITYIAQPTGRGNKCDGQSPKHYNLSPKHAFGLIETIIAGIVVITVVGSSVILRQRSTDRSAISRHQTQAYLLAQEGIEAVRDIRDTNYLVARYDSTSTSFLKTPWTCDLIKNIRTDIKTISPAYNTLVCDPNGSASLSDNSGNFVSNVGSPGGPLELGNGFEYGLVFRDVQGGNNVQLALPAWSLSSPRLQYDAGGYFSNETRFLMKADSEYGNDCNGIERIFTREKDVSGGTDPADARLSANAINKDVRSNRRLATNFTAADQDNYWISGDPNIQHTIAGCFAWPVPNGYFEFRRQVTVSPVDFTADGNLSRGDLPASWASDGQTHLLRVLVRVSWRETSRYTALGDQKSVLLATYLSDWKPAN